MEQLPHKRMLVRTLVDDEGAHQLMYVDLTTTPPTIESFGGIERHSTVFIDGLVKIVATHTPAPTSATTYTPYLLSPLDSL